ncbi:ATP-binding protein [Micavibrio aeruginosavorus]|uniref:ATP-binding protein n=1 Tax=Micavibrio aeruginosavorus TaxID=349221 RepID=UPI003F4AB363
MKIRSLFRNILPRTLLARSLMILIIPVLLTQMITVYIFFDRHWGKMTDRLAYAVAGEMAIVAEQIENDPSPERISRISGHMAKHLDLLISYQPGAVLENIPEDIDRSIVSDILGRALDQQVRRPYRINVDLSEKWVEIAIALNDGVLFVSSPQRRLFSSSGYIFLLWMIFTSIVLLAVSILFMRNQIRPIRRLAVAAERIGKGRDMPATLKVEGAREVRQAAQAFLDMNDRIKRQISQRTAMLAGVSHDLRTPLTRLKLQVAMLGNHPDAEGMMQDIQDMEKMLNGYLDFVRGEGGEQAVAGDMNDILNRIVSGARRAGGDVILDSQGDLALTLRPMAMERALSNLITNARKYASHVWMSARRVNDDVEIVIDDDGPGIPPDQYDDVFRPFYRVDTSRNTATGGVGLGLPIAQDVIHSHGGQITLDQSPRGGLRVIILIPV